MRNASTILRIAAILAFLTLLSACSSVTPNRDPHGETFPIVDGKTLEGKAVVLPTDFRGAPVLFLIGYEQETQFDCDRWILGLLQAKTPVKFLEVPTIPGLLPGMFAGQIDDGMRTGIPHEDWAGVVTLYDDEAAKIAEFTGNEKNRNARVLLLDADGRVVWFHDRGYSAGKLLEVDARVRAMGPRPSGDGR